MEPSDSLNKGRLIGVSATGAAIWGGSITGLNYVWYSGFEKSPFHLFDDSREWGQMDKVGHLYSAWQLTALVSNMYEWSGLDHKKSALIGAAYSFGYLASFEALDGFASQWGFSLSDIGFNTIGTVTYASQKYLWNEQYVRFKFSYGESGLAEFRPNVLGSDFTSKLLKDYNAQTYWLSFNPFNWSKKESVIPKWMNLSMGYGIHNQLIGDGGTYVISDGPTQQTFTPYRQYFLSLDIDFQKIQTNSRFLKTVFRALNVVKLPFPTLEFSQGNFQFHPFYF